MVSAPAWQLAVVALLLTRVVPRAVNVWLLKPNIALLDTGLLGGVAGVSDVRTQDYSRKRRIVKTDEFSSVFRLRPVHRTAHFVLYIRDNNLTHPRLGVIAAKRYAPRAVTRNTIKRITRELFRQSSLPPVDCIVRLSKPINSKTDSATSASLKKLVRAEVTRLFISQSAAGAS
jgi:ribonuclease P protein component